jgi:SHS2 domain-containing protein
MAEPLFREIEHTADLGIEVESDSPGDLFRRAGLALFFLMVNVEKVEPREEREESVQAEGWDDLLHDWLSRLLSRFLQEGFIAATITIEEIDATHIRARLAGEKLDYDRHEFETEIKAVTYHQLSVTCENGRWRARVIFDV